MKRRKEPAGGRFLRWGLAAFAAWSGCALGRASTYAPSFTSRLTSGVTFQSRDAGLQRLFDAAEAGLARNAIEMGGMKIITEGGGYAPGVYLESAPLGGLLYAARDPQVGLNQQVAFILRPRADGRMSAGVFNRELYVKRGGIDIQAANGMSWYPEVGLLASFQSLAHDWNLPDTGWKLYLWTGRDRAYLERLYAVVEAYDAHLWRTRDSNGDGVLEVWCNYDTGEDRSTRYLLRGAPTRWPFDHPPGGPGMPDPRDPASYKSFWMASAQAGLPPPRPDAIRVPFASMDLMAWSYEGRIALAKMARELGNGREAYWRGKAEEVRRKAIARLWVPDRQACFDRDRDGRILPELVHNNLRAMHHGLFTQEMADAFIRAHLLNPREFWTYAPLPSIAADEKLFVNDPDNDWSGQPEGLTYQRAVRALENYGHYAEVSLVGAKLFQLIEQNNTSFPQQFDPFTGKGCGRGDYSPTMFAALDYVSRLHGIFLDVENGQVWWSALDGEGGDFAYGQRWGGRRWTLVCERGRIHASLDGREVFSGTAGARIVSDLDGNVREVVGIASGPRSVDLQSAGRRVQLTVAPNQVWSCGGDAPAMLRATPFDYPYRSPAL